MYAYIAFSAVGWVAGRASSL